MNKPGSDSDATRPCIAVSQSEALCCSTSSVLLDLTCYILLAVDKGPATDSVIPNVSKLLGPLSNIFLLTFDFDVFPRRGSLLSSGVVSEEFFPSWVQRPKAPG